MLDDWGKLDHEALSGESSSGHDRPAPNRSFGHLQVGLTLFSGLTIAFLCGALAACAWPGSGRMSNSALWSFPWLHHSGASARTERQHQRLETPQGQDLVQLDSQPSQWGKKGGRRHPGHQAWPPAIASLRAQNHQLEAENAELKRQVRLLKESSSGRYDSGSTGHSHKTTGDALATTGDSGILSPGRRGKRFAYVTLAYDEPGSTNYLWSILPIARALQKLSSFPLIVLTNSTYFSDGTPVEPALRVLNAYVVPVHKIVRQKKNKFAFSSWNVAFWKLQIWNLTQYEKLIWLDSDSIVYRGMDWLFTRNGMWAQRDDWFCKLRQPKVCSGIMLLYPNISDYEGMLAFDAKSPNLNHGDQQLISEYFSKVRGTKVQLLDDVDASFGQCLGRAPSPYRNSDGSAVRGIWSTPSFVHKSGGWGDTDNNAYNNVCFSHNMSRQYYILAGLTVNVCHYHPLGAYWRALFCEATALAGVAGLYEVAAFCSDDCWYLGGEVGCRPVTTSSDYNPMSSLSGMPEPEMELALDVAAGSSGGGGELAE